MGPACTSIGANNVQAWLITGCSRGLGRALADEVLKSGDRLVATARNQEALSDPVASAGDRIIVMPLDMTDTAAAVRAVAAPVLPRPLPG